MFQSIAPMAEIERTPSLDKLLDESDILSIHLFDAKGMKHEVNFDAPLAYRKIPESYTLKTLNEIANSADLSEHFYVTKKSNFIDWFKLESGPLSDDIEVFHYAITLMNEIIEVLATEPPTFLHTKIDSA